MSIVSPLKTDFGQRMGMLNQGKMRANSEFSPSDVAGLVLWLDGNEGITLNGDNVSAWADQSGNGNDFAMTTESAQPLYEATGLNGHGIVTFDGVDEYLTTTGDFLASITATHFFIVVKMDYGSDTTQAIFDLGGAGGYRFYRYGGGANNQEFRLEVNESVVTGVNYGDFTSDTWHLAEGSYSNAQGSVKGYVDGTEDDSVNASGDITIAASTSLLGRMTSGGYFLLGSIAELLIYNAVISGDDLTNIRAYLNDKYGL